MRVMWFRNDLRVSDNRALHQACRDAGRAGSVVGVFLLADEQWRLHDMAGVKADLILRTLAALRQDLETVGVPLVVIPAPRFNDAPEAIAGLAGRLGAEGVYYNREYEVNERRRDAAVEKALATSGVPVHAFDDQVLLAPGSVRTGEGKYFTVFTPFKRAYFRALEEQGLLEGPARVLGRPPTVTPPETRLLAKLGGRTIPTALQGLEPHVAPDLWPPGEAEAVRRLDRFVDRSIAEYKNRRDFPGEDGTSTLSPYLSIGCISPRRCLAAALDANGGKLEQSAARYAGATHWISELIWREFYRHLIVGFPRVCMGKPFKPATSRIAWSDRRDHFDAWREGRTGVPIVDAGMRQLLRTGWMHNRVRMIAAMYLTKDLFIDWRWGERHFMRHLVDGDLAQNNSGWQWSASTGTDAAPYFRIFNPVTQSRRFDPDGAYIRRFVLELASLGGGEHGVIHDPGELPPLARARLDYPEPLVDRAASRERVLTAFQRLA